MEESHVKGLATDNVLRLRIMRSSSQGKFRSVDRVRAGWVFSRERNKLRDADAVGGSGRQHRASAPRDAFGSRPVRDPVRMYADTSHENREIVCSPTADGGAGRVGKSKDGCKPS
jgi:hypothetical protein